MAAALISWIILLPLNGSSQWIIGSMGVDCYRSAGWGGCPTRPSVSLFVFLVRRVRRWCAYRCGGPFAFDPQIRQPAEPARQVPVAVAQQRHARRHQHAANDRRVEDDG